MAKLTPQREKEIRKLLVARGGFYTSDTARDIRALLSEIDALRAVVERGCVRCNEAQRGGGTAAAPDPEKAR